MIATGPQFIATGPQSERPGPRSLQFDNRGVEATLNRNGYTTKVLTEMLGIKSAELRALFKHELGSDRARDLKEQMLAAGLPV
jgi:hypothetical protein